MNKPNEEEKVTLQAARSIADEREQEKLEKAKCFLAERNALARKIELLTKWLDMLDEDELEEVKNQVEAQYDRSRRNPGKINYVV